MRTPIRIAACVTFSLVLAAPAGSQGILGRIKQKAADAVEKKAEDKVNSKIDQLAQKMVDNSFAALFGDSAGAEANAPGGSSGSRAGGGLPFSLGSNVATESSYRFDIVTTMEIESVARSGKSSGKALMMMHFSTGSPYTGTRIVSPDGKNADGSAFVVLDAKNHAMVMLMESDKSKFSIAYDWKDAQKYAEAAHAPTEQVNWDTVKVWRNYSRIGTKTIAGYAADGYRAESPDATVELWVSHDRKLGAGGMFGANSGLKQMRGRLPDDYPQGLLLEMTSVNAGSGEKVTMKVTKIDTNANVSYSMADYPKMEMGKK